MTLDTQYRRSNGQHAQSDCSGRDNLLDCFVLLSEQNNRVNVSEVFPRHVEGKIPVELLSAFCSDLVFDKKESVSEDKAESFVLPQIDGFYYYVSVIRHVEILESFSNQAYYCMCLLSRRPCLAFMESSLTALSSTLVENECSSSLNSHNSSMSFSSWPSSSSLSVTSPSAGPQPNTIMRKLEPYLNGLIHQSRLPDASKILQVVFGKESTLSRYTSSSSLNLMCINAENKDRSSQTSSVNILPRVSYLPFVDDRSFVHIMSVFKSETIVRVMEHLLMEDSLIIHSKKFATLTPCAESLLSLMYPFIWQGIYSPALVKNDQSGHNMDSFVERLQPVLRATCPFLIGWCSRTCFECSNLERNCPNCERNTIDSAQRVVLGMSQPRRCVILDLDRGSIQVVHSGNKREANHQFVPAHIRDNIKSAVEENQYTFLNSNSSIQSSCTKHKSAEVNHEKIPGLTPSSSSNSLASMYSSTSNETSFTNSSWPVEEFDSITTSCVDKFRTIFLQLFLHLFSSVNNYLEHWADEERNCVHAGIREKEYLECLSESESNFVRPILKSRMFLDFINRTVRGQMLDFEVLKGIWSDIGKSGKGSNYSRDMRDTIFDMLSGMYEDNQAKRITRRLLQLESPEAILKLLLRKDLKERIDELMGKEDRKNTFGTPKQSALSNLYSSIARGNTPPGPPSVLQLPANNPPLLTTEDITHKDFMFQWSVHSARNCAILLKPFGNDLEDETIKSPRQDYRFFEEEKSEKIGDVASSTDAGALQYVIYRERIMYRDAISALSAQVSISQTPTKENKRTAELLKENERLKMELDSLRQAANNQTPNTTHRIPKRYHTSHGPIPVHSHLPRPALRLRERRTSPIFKQTSQYPKIAMIRNNKSEEVNVEV